MTCWKSFLALSNSFMPHNASPLRNRAFSLAASNSRAYSHTENDEMFAIFNMELMLLIALNKPSVPDTRPQYSTTTINQIIVKCLMHINISVLTMPLFRGGSMVLSNVCQA